jgi:hypothetical protein
MQPSRFQLIKIIFIAVETIELFIVHNYNCNIHSQKIKIPFSSSQASIY